MQVAAACGDAHVLGGTTCVAAALESPGLIVQTGVHRSVTISPDRFETLKEWSALYAVLEPWESGDPRRQP